MLGSISDVCHGLGKGQWQQIFCCIICQPFSSSHIKILSAKISAIVRFLGVFWYKFKVICFPYLTSALPSFYPITVD